MLSIYGALLVDVITTEIAKVNDTLLNKQAAVVLETHNVLSQGVEITVK